MHSQCSRVPCAVRNGRRGARIRQRVIRQCLVHCGGLRRSCRTCSVQKGTRLQRHPSGEKGRFIIIGDADDSYDFSQLSGYMNRLRNGADLVRVIAFRAASQPRDASSAPLCRQSDLELYRTPVFPDQHRRFPLWTARLFARIHSAVGASDSGNGVRQRNGRQGGAGGLSRRRGSHHAEAGRPQPAAPSENMARWLAPPAFPSAVLSPLVISLPRSGAPGAGTRRVVRSVERTAEFYLDRAGNPFHALHGCRHRARNAIDSTGFSDQVDGRALA